MCGLIFSAFFCCTLEGGGLIIVFCFDFFSLLVSFESLVFIESAVLDTHFVLSLRLSVSVSTKVQCIAQVSIFPICIYISLTLSCSYMTHKEKTFEHFYGAFDVGFVSITPEEKSWVRCVYWVFFVW